MSLIVWSRLNGSVAQPPTTSLAIGRPIHSKSAIPRGRAGIRATSARSKRGSSPSHKAAASATTSQTTTSPTPQDNAVDQEAQLRKAAAAWPSWLPKPSVYAAAELREQREKQQEQDRVAYQNRSRHATQQVEGVFISKDSPQHSSRKQQKDGASNFGFGLFGKRRSFSTLEASATKSESSYQHPQQESPSSLPPSPEPFPAHPITQWFHRKRRGS
ncbi:hypothetical protein BDZ90DRAFT_225179 [Jaminaea rosea]|uniref:Uncharacterized protein n=1 Tax=Jaminaea rosea TaxID=1569628 RepID=A0A316V175_9BASI|nr:hypothetical protein BDZ90DRAFT_225179 [Jaminaea rosea]PWN30301.1 hypothetical protein BDZ90DRAFT_225179 [Jaminaea rosea]